MLIFFSPPGRLYWSRHVCLERKKSSCDSRRFWNGGCKGTKTCQVCPCLISPWTSDSSLSSNFCLFSQSVISWFYSELYNEITVWILSDRQKKAFLEKQSLAFGRRCLSHIHVSCLKLLIIFLICFALLCRHLNVRFRQELLNKCCPYIF